MTALSVAIATSGITTLLALATAAHADIRICNDFRAPIHVALANQDQGNFAASGWWRVNPNDCQAIDFTLSGATLYYAANSDQYTIGRTNYRHHWGNKVKLFVTEHRFDFENAELARRGTVPAMFSEADIAEPYSGKPSTVTVRFAEGITTVNVKTNP